MSKTTIFIVIVLVILGFVFFSGSDSEENGEVTEQNNQEEVAESNSDNSDTGDESMDESVEGMSDEGGTTIVFDGSSYSPSSVTVSQGEMVTFVNESDGEMWPASDAHPTHEAYSGTTRSEHCGDAGSETFDACKRVAAGESYSFIFDKTGEWDYHDHLSPSAVGTVVVE